MAAEDPRRARRMVGISVEELAKTVSRELEERDSGSLDGSRQRPLIWMFGLASRFLATRRANRPVRPAMVTVVGG